MNDIYENLAAHLDKLPAGFPRTASGVEIRILKRLFTRKEAEIATALTMIPEPAPDVAARLKEDPERMEAALSAMARKGLIFRISKKDQNLYSASQFVVGIWEYHLNDLDEALIKDVNEYMPALLQESWVKADTKQLRVVPVAKSVSAEMAIMPYEAAEAIISRQSKIVVSDCICRKEQRMIGKGCDKPMETCFTFGAAAQYYEENKLGREIDQAEALVILKSGIDAGLVLQPGNQQKAINICMCCGCCCGVLKNLKSLDSPARIVHTNFYARVDETLCSACEACVERCQMAAIQVDDVARIDLDRCIGCGLCVTDCPTGAIVLVQKDEKNRYLPPKNAVETYLRMAQERAIRKK